ncbi:hypothetical protein GTY54_28755, partial [Streptomyces sp. SID625]|nr:hypothetical protein [Streptomyces sp. SID625]
MSQLSPDARAVVRAVDALTTPVRRIADTLSSGTCDASTLGAVDRHLGPCLLRADHDGPVRRGPEGETWATVVRVADDDVTTSVDEPTALRDMAATLRHIDSEGFREAAACCEARAFAIEHD